MVDDFAQEHQFLKFLRVVVHPVYVMEEHLVCSVIVGNSLALLDVAGSPPVHGSYQGSL